MIKTTARVLTTDEEIDAAIARSESAHRLAAAGYDATTDAVTVRFTDGITASFPRRSLQGLKDATSVQLAEVEVQGAMGLFWPTLDVAHYVPGLLSGIFGTRKWLAENGRRGGSAKTAAKASASRANGAKGGRPKQTVTTGKTITFEVDTEDDPLVKEKPWRGILLD